MLKQLVLQLIGFYRRVLSPLKRASTCRFLPTCSEYAEDAVTLHGIGRGGWLAAKRLLRCHPLCRGGFDPVPRRGPHGGPAIMQDRCA